MLPLGLYIALERDENYSLLFERGPRLDMGMYVVGALALLLLGFEAIKVGNQRLRPVHQPVSFMQPVAVQRPLRALLFGCLQLIGGGIVFLAAMFLVIENLAGIECMFYSRGTLPDWVPERWWSVTNMIKDCQDNYKAIYKGVAGVALDTIVVLGALSFALIWLFRGVPGVLSFWRRGPGPGQRGETELSLSDWTRSGALAGKSLLPLRLWSFFTARRRAN
jgi:hypothetical protein